MALQFTNAHKKFTMKKIETFYGRVLVFFLAEFLKNQKKIDKQLGFLNRINLPRK